ncbi:putative ER transporter 6TM N-terminal domain-containing protein [Seiridium unicorne]|uniref:ER transporter 6TM N-terminal domain-containing protein n=1 Tax=Seiridium unicorne TaxID=138068 RepID=A0ABR2UHG4_9PEZI
MVTAKRAREWRRRCKRWRVTVSENLRKGHLWQRVTKNTTCTTIMLSLGLVPAVIQVYGRSTYLGAMVTVFGHPGQRFGQMAEALFLIFTGTAVGLGWSTLGLYLSSLAHESNVSAAYAIRAVFFALAVILHGTLRSSTPRLFLFVFFYLLISLTVLTTTTISVSSALVSQIAYPILSALAVILFVNVFVFPESSSGFLGNSVIETLHDTVKCLEDAVDWFATARNEDQNQESPAQSDAEKPSGPSLHVRLVSLTDRKPKLRAKFAGSKKAQAECNFEVVYAVLPPESLKPISMTSMSRLVQNTISVINACESKYAMLGEGQDGGQDPGAESNSDTEDDDSSTDSSSDVSSDSESSESAAGKPKNIRRKSKHARNLELVKPVREIESGDIELFDHILSQVQGPTKVLQNQIHEAVELIACSLAYCYEVAKLPSGALAPHGITLEEIDLRTNVFAEALALFDKNSAEALEHAAAIGHRGSKVDVMPRTETFLISSFLLTLRQAASQILHMLRHSRQLVEKRQARHSRRRIYFPRISWKKWLKTGGERDINAIPENARKEARAGRGTRLEDGHFDKETPSTSNEQLFRQRKDEEASGFPEKLPDLPVQGGIRHRKGPHKSDSSTSLWLRGLAADAIEFIASSDDLAFALKMSFAGWLVTWPAFVPSLNAWYGMMRASWASLQLILVFEVSVGTSIQGFLLRVVGVIYGCLAGFLSYEIGQGNRVVAVVVLVIASIPASYTQLGTPYVKTGIISIVSMSVVGLATIVTPDNHPWEIFIKRMVCFLIGGTVALLVELTLFPVRARDRLVESLASAIQQISNMEASVAVGIESPNSVDLRSEALRARFNSAKDKAEAALTAAQTFLPFTLTEPRLKGSFRGQAMIYNEILYVLHQIIDRMDHVLHLREAYGSTVLEELNEFVLPYRRNIAGSITLTLFAVHEALTTRLPLPQFLPSSRVAHLRYVTRVREVILDQNDSVPGSSAASIFPGKDSRRSSRIPEAHVLKSVTKQKFLSWNAGSAGMMEIIEYLEELVDLAKLLVGVNAFRTGMLERPKFHEYIAKIKAREMVSATAAEAKQTIEKIKSNADANIRKGRGYSSGRSDSHGGMLSKRMTFAPGRMGADAAVDSDSSDEVDNLPMSLQRVRTRRMEELQAERVRRASMVDHKGKGVLRGAKTWAA